MFSQKRVGYFTVAARIMVIATLGLGVVYPLVITGISELFMRDNANGSLIVDAQGQARGSDLIAQSFSDAEGLPLAQYFQPRPSAAGDGWDALSSGGSNLGPNSSELLSTITQRQQEFAEFNGVPVADVPADAVTASASGLDPHISWENAALQESRVAQARGLDVDVVHQLVLDNAAASTSPESGSKIVKVVRLNLELDELGSAN